MVSQEVAEVIKDIPQDQAILVFTFKARPSDRLDHIQTLKQDLQGRGINTEAQVQVKGTDGQVTSRPRFVWLTWGQETALSQYSYCPNVVFAGVLHRSLLDLSANTAGENDNLTVDLDNAALNDTRDSEVAHCLYQAMSRGASRRMFNGVARHSNIYLIHGNGKIKDLLNDVMPGARWETWEGKYLTKKQTKMENVMEAIMAFLNVCTDLRISVRELRKQTGLDDIHRNTFNRGLKKALEKLSGWMRERQSLVKMTAEAYGFDTQ